MSDEFEQESQAPATVTLRVASAWHTRFIFHGEDGSTLVVEQKGTEVPADLAPDLIETAARHGVTLVESEQ